MFAGGESLRTRQASATRDGWTLVVTVDDETGGAKSWSYELTTRGETAIVARATRAGSDGVLTSRVRRGPASGAGSAELVAVTSDGKIFEGQLDGRPLAPFSADAVRRNPPDLRYADGSPAAFDVDSTVLGYFRVLYPETHEALARCDEGGGRRPEGVAPASELPHQTNLNEQCSGCKKGCAWEYYACIVGAAATCGPFAVLCGGGCAYANKKCHDNCKATGGACCPVPCGPRCCWYGEMCADLSTGTCCSSGFQVCSVPNGPLCYEPKQETCFPGQRVCPMGHEPCPTKGSQRCYDPAVEQCIEKTGETCPIGARVCDGTICCMFGDCAVGPHGPTCCPGSSTTCYATKKCCPGRDTCPDGVNCCPEEQACGGICCAKSEICDRPTMTCVPRKVCGEPLPVYCIDPFDGDMCCGSGTTACCRGACCPEGETCCYEGCKPSCIH